LTIGEDGVTVRQDIVWLSNALGGVDKTLEIPVTVAALELAPIDLLYLVNSGKDQRCRRWDDILFRYVINNLCTAPDATIRILIQRRC